MGKINSTELLEITWTMEYLGKENHLKECFKDYIFNLFKTTYSVEVLFTPKFISFYFASVAPFWRDSKPHVYLFLTAKPFPQMRWFSLPLLEHITRTLLLKRENESLNS